MFHLRRTAFRALCRSSSTPFIASARTISTTSPSILRAQQQQWTKSMLAQRRFISDQSTTSSPSEATETVEATEAIEATEAAAEAKDGAKLDEAAKAQESPEGATPRKDTRNKTLFLDNPNAPPASNRLYFGNLFFEVNEEHLQSLLSKFGPVKSVQIIYDNRGLNKGFGFAEFENQADAVLARDSLHNQVFHNRTLNVQFQDQKTNNNKQRPRPARTPSPPSTSLFIGNLSFEMSDKDINDLFRELQSVKEVRVAVDRVTGRLRGFAHVDFHDQAAATEAREKLMDKEIYGRRLFVDYAAGASYNKR